MAKTYIKRKRIVKKKSLKRALQTLKEIAARLVMAITAVIMVFTIFSVATFDKNNRSIFGYRFYIVRSDSMSATDFDAGDIIFIKIVDPNTLAEGDIIAYTSQNLSNYGETVTHKIRVKTVNQNGEVGFITYGTTTGTNDETVVTYPYILGKYTGKIANVGEFFAFLKTTKGYILCILLPFLALIGYNGVNCVVLFKKYKKEKTEELNAEKEKLISERKKTEEMLRELESLRAQLEKDNAKGNKKL